MSTTIRIDNEVYAWLQSQARPFDDTPNSVLRRISGLSMDKTKEPIVKKRYISPAQTNRKEKTPQRAYRTPILKLLRKQHGEMPRSRVLEELEREMADRLTDHDKKNISSGSIRWQKSAEWEVRVMREDGLLKPDEETPRGVWALTDKGWAEPE